MQSSQFELTYKVFVFDFDGTLVDSNNIKLQGFYKSVERHINGKELMDQVLGSVSGNRFDIFYKYNELRLRKGLPIFENESVLVNRYSEIVETIISNLPEISGASILLKKIKEFGSKIYLSSATPQDSLENILKSRSWFGLFDGIIGSPQNKYTTLLRIIESNNLKPNELAVVGDGIDDYQSAADCKCNFYLVGNGSCKGLNLEKWDLVQIKKSLMKMVHN